MKKEFEFTAIAIDGEQVIIEANSGVIQVGAGEFPLLKRRWRNEQDDYAQ